MNNTSIILEPTSGKADYSVIWMHGLGADGNDFVSLVPELQLPESPGIRFIFPHAPIRPITLNGGMDMRGWYDIYSLEDRSRQDEQGVLESAALIHHMIDAEIEKGIKAENIILAGFSQGGAIALFAGLTYGQKLSGILALSTYLPIQETFFKQHRTANQNTPIYMAHGSHDPIIPFAMALESCEQLTAENYAVAWHSYPMEHSLCADELRDVREWFLKHTG